MRIGLFGGTFDPPHIAHLALAESARSFAKLDRIIWIPASQPPHRIGKPVASPVHRLEMSRLSIEGNDDFEVSDIELRRAGESYTVDTIREVRTENPLDELFLIVGGDSLRTFHTWRDPAGILALAELVAFGRDRDHYLDVDLDILESTTVIPDAPLIGVSSSRIRKMIASGMSIRYLVPDAVADYIRTNRLYGPDG